MGIKYLNSYLQRNCRDSINSVHFNELYGKKIAVDVSIYMYKYEADGLLLENMFLLISIMHYYGIIPIFVFEGKTPAEKKDLIEKRAEVRNVAKAEIAVLKEIVAKNEVKDVEEKNEILATIEQLKKKTTQINYRKIAKVKALMRAYGVTYFDAHGEADQLCAMLTITGKVWACMSEDMDMFVYGCPRVIRYLSLLNHTLVLYDMKGILVELGISQKELREICILSGTDYNKVNDNDDTKNHSLYTTLKHFKKYHNSKSKKENENVSFYNWLLNNTNYIEDYDTLITIYNLFDLTKNYCNIKVFEDIRIANGPIMKNSMNEILKTIGFIFKEVEEV